MKTKKRHRHHRKENQAWKIIRRILPVLQLLVCLVLVMLLWDSGMAPKKYLAGAVVLSAAAFALTFGLQWTRKRALQIMALILSIIVIIPVSAAAFYVNKGTQLLQDVGGATYKTDQMVVVVKKDDPAENIMDLSSYRFGYQTAVDQDNNNKMLEDVKATVGNEIKLVDYPSLTEEAQALLDGRVEAAIYNDGFTGLIEDAIEGYSDQVRVIYKYGIKTELDIEETSVEQPFYVYISGIDVSGPVSTTSRSDVNLIMTVNPDTKKILLTTTPRDYYVQIPGISGGQKDKLTHAGIYGVDASIATLEQLYGIDISYYARVNFTSLVTIVDALGGIDVNSDYEFTTTHGDVQIQKGINHMDGETALGFARERYSFTSGDNQRGKNQEAVLTAILQKAMTPAVLKNVDDIMTGVRDSVETNMTQEEMAELINMQLETQADWSIESQAVSGTGDSQSCYSSGSQLLYVMQPDEASVQAAAARMKTIENGK